MKRFLTTAALALSLAAPVSAQTSADLFKPVTDIATGADRHDWPRVRAAFADTVTLDYTSLWGGTPSTQPADEVIAQWASLLPGFESTHHMVTNHTVASQTATTATVEADFTATHRIDEDLWVLGGRYHYELVQNGGTWQVTSLTMTALWETGSRDLVGQAAERAAAAN